VTRLRREPRQKTRKTSGGRRTTLLGGRCRHEQDTSLRIGDEGAEFIPDSPDELLDVLGGAGAQPTPSDDEYMLKDRGVLKYIYSS